MGFKSQETLGTVKGADRLNENKKFGDIWGKTKNIMTEMTSGPGFTNEGDLEEGKQRDMNNTAMYLIDLNKELEGETDKGVIKLLKQDIQDAKKKLNDIKKGGKPSTMDKDESIEEGEHIKSGMGGSNKGKSRTDKTEVLKKKSKKQRRKAGKEATKDADKEAAKNINEDDVANFQDALGSNPKVVNAAKKLNTPIEKIEAADEFINNIAGDDDALIGKIIRAVKKDDSDVVNEMEIADDYSERESMAREYQENPKRYISTINSLLNEYIRKKGIPGDLGFVPNNPLKGDIALFSSPELLIDVTINSKFGFDVYYTQHVDSEDFDNIYGEPEASYHSPERMDMDTVANNVSFDQALIKVGELLGNDVSEEKEMNRFDEDDLPPPPSYEEEQAAQVYEDRFDEVFEGMYEEDDY